MISIIVHILANAAAIWAASHIVPGFVFQGDWKDLLVAGVVLGVVNSLIRPIVKLLSFPIILLTLGLFTAVINIAMLFLVSWFLPTLSIHGLWAAVWGVILISFVNHVIVSIFHKHSEGK
jgi:putative membrane protein